MANEVSGDRNGETLVDVDGGDVGETRGEEVNEEVRGAGSADADGGACESLEAEPARADEGARVATGLGVETAEDLDEQLVR